MQFLLKRIIGTRHCFGAFSAPYIHSLNGRECMSPHSPGVGPRARSRPGTGRASRAGPETQTTKPFQYFPHKTISM